NIIFLGSNHRIAVDGDTVCSVRWVIGGPTDEGNRRARHQQRIAGRLPENTTTKADAVSDNDSVVCNTKRRDLITGAATTGISVQFATESSKHGHVLTELARGLTIVSVRIDRRI